jgi:hypothetical protein
MQRNQLSNILLLTSLVIGVLLLLYFIPPFKIGNTKIKKINILADVEQAKIKSLAKTGRIKNKIALESVSRRESCKKGVTCIEDYSEGKRALWHFFSSLNQVTAKPVRIAFFGDSFIEGDILTASLRDTLQSLFGGQGVGYVPVASEVARFRSTIKHTFSNWTTYSFVSKKNHHYSLGTPGYCFIPEKNNTLEFKPVQKRFINQFNRIRLFYSNTQSDSLRYTINDTSHYTVELPATGSLGQLTINTRKAKTIKFEFSAYDSLKLYGLSFDEPKGIYVDNLAMRGNSGLGLLQVTDQMHREFDEYQNYKLIILQYGLNVVSENDSSGYTWYTKRMVKVVNGLKQSFPNSSILIVSVSDRSTNQDGKFTTMRGIKEMRRIQREIARECKVAFWDLYAAMGGENSMIKFVEAKPPLAAKDYTHLTYQGGIKLAQKLAETLLYERERYVPKKKN